MNTQHIASASDDSDGFSPASLQTTVNGLELILQALRIIEPEAPEAGLRTALVNALEKAMPLCPEHQYLSAKTDAEVYDFNQEVFRRQAQFGARCKSQLDHIGLYNF
jgi:hypothetical protein